MKINYFTYCDKNNFLPAQLLSYHVYNVSKIRLIILGEFIQKNKVTQTFELQHSEPQFIANVSGHITKAAYGRIEGFKQLKNTADWLVYLDTDILFKNNMASFLSQAAGNLYMTNHNLDEFLLKYNIPKGPYFNSGVIAMRTVFVDEFLASINRELALGREYIFHDQCLINIACQGSVCELPSDFNSSELWGELQREGNVHFTGPRKPWNVIIPNKLQREYMKGAIILSKKDKVRLRLNTVSGFFKRLRSVIKKIIILRSYTSL